MTEPVTYYVADVVSGVVLDTLPLSGEVAKTRGEVESVSWTLPLGDERMPSDWANLIQPWKNMIVAEWRGRLVQGWVIVGETFGDPTLPLQAATLERLTEKVFVRDYENYDVDLAQIAADIIGQVMVPAGGWQVQWSPTGTHDDVYHDLGAGVTVNSALESYQAAEGGPVWMCDVDWVPGETGRQVQKTVYIAPKLGTVRPEAIFTADPGEYTRSVDWTGDNAALEVWGVTEGSGGQGMTETSWRSPKLDQGWHPNEAFVTFTDLDEDQLAARRDRRGPELADGTVVWEATLRIDEQPVLGDEWNIGDTVTLRANPGKYDPQGGEITADVQGWVLNVDDGTIVVGMIQEGDDNE